MDGYADSYLDLRKKTLEKLFCRMNPMQREAVFKVKGPLLILAGAGSGKTTVLINRVENLIRFGDAFHSTAIPEGIGEDAISDMRAFLASDAPLPLPDHKLAVEPVNPWNILAITFTNKAAGELRSRLENVLGAIASEVTASTFHSLCVRILRRNIESIGYERNFTIYDTDDSLRVIKNAMKLLNINDKLFTPRSILSAIGNAKDHMSAPDNLLAASKNDYRLEIVAKIYDLYSRALKDANALDFDDIIMLTVKLFQQNASVLEYYQNRYKYIMVDEYQDTNHVQYLLISMLAAAHGNLCVVGDDDQSIYKFRGATIENILRFEEQFPDVCVVRLEQNYRSTQNILSAANKIIANNTARKGKNLWTDSGLGELVSVVSVRDEEAESRFVADTILDNVKAGAKFSEHAILYRMNAQSNAVEKMLARSAVPYRIVGGVRFYERKEIKDVIAYMSLINNHNDNLRLLRIIGEPRRGLGNSTLGIVQEISENLGISLFEVMQSSYEYDPLIKKSQPLIDFAALIEDLTGFSESNKPSSIVEEIIERTGYRAMLETQGAEGLIRLENIMELKSNLVQYEQNNEEASLGGFLEEIALYTDLDNYDPSEDAVVLMTVHSAKGLEFDNVFIVGMEEGIFPGRASLNSIEELEEERRLVYVAITRARHNLTITTARKRMIFGQTFFGQKSRFIAEIPNEFKADKDFTIVKAANPKTQFVFTSNLYVNARKSAESAHKIGVCNSAENSGQTFIPAQQVSHAVFGSGTILSSKPVGGDTFLEIDFAGSGIKKIMANYARLTKI